MTDRLEIPVLPEWFTICGETGGEQSFLLYKNEGTRCKATRRTAVESNWGHRRTAWRISAHATHACNVSGREATDAAMSLRDQSEGRLTHIVLILM